MSLKNKNINYETWDSNRNIIKSRKGGWFPGKGVFNHGYNMMDDFVGKKSYMQIVLLNATGRLPDRKIADWFEAIHICLSWPDPRIWCNQIGALAGTSRTSVVAATVSGILASDSRAYGAKTIKGGLEFIQNAFIQYSSGKTVEEIVNAECAKNAGKPYIMGFARPIAKGDERVEAMERTAKNLDLEIGKHLKLAYQIEQILIEKFDESMNINGYMSAFLSDNGFTPDEAYRICSFVVASGVTACYVDSKDKEAGTFLPLHCDDIKYTGKAQRNLPDY